MVILPSAVDCQRSVSHPHKSFATSSNPNSDNFSREGLPVSICGSQPIAAPTDHQMLGQRGVKYINYHTS